MSTKNLALTFVVIAIIVVAITGILQVTGVISTEEMKEAMTKGGLVIVILLVVTLVVGYVKKLGSN